MFRAISLFLIYLFWSPSGHAQVPAPAPPAATASAAKTDPLGRTTPQGSLLRFLEAAQKENYPLASKYLQSYRRRASTEEEAELVRQLKVLLDRNFVGRLDAVSNDPSGSQRDGLSPDREKAGEIQRGGQVFDLIVVRVDDPQAGKIWLISTEIL